MSRALQWLAILGVLLIVGGIWSGFQGREDGPVSHPAIRSNAESTKNFWARPETLDDHFRRHGADFQARDAADYARQAHLHLQRAYSSGLPTKRETNGALLVFDPRTGAFGAYNSDGTTRTFFKPDS